MWKHLSFVSFEKFFLLHIFVILSTVLRKCLNCKKSIILMVQSKNFSASGSCTVAHIGCIYKNVAHLGEICHGESTRNSKFVDTNVQGPKARVHLYYKSTVPSAFSDLKYCLIV